MARGTGGMGAVLVLSLLCGIMAATAGCTFGYVTDAIDTGSELACGSLSGLERDHCYQYAARLIQDRALCDRIGHPGPKSKCRIYLYDCENRDLSWTSTGDGAYTRNDCYQYNAVQFGSIMYCRYMQEGYQSGGNDLNPGRVSRETCIQRVTATCGHIGQDACLDTKQNQRYCVEGQMDRAKCVPEG